MSERKIENLKTGTTTLGIMYNGGVILSAERKATMGYLVASKNTRKIVKLTDRLGMTIAGSVGDAQALERYLRAEIKLYEMQEDRKMPIKSVATLVSNILYSRAYFPYYVQLLIGGMDNDAKLFSFDPSGSVIEEKEYFSTGSGSVMALGVLENGFEKGMDIESAKKLAVRAVKAATERDIASGGSGIDLVVINSNGFHKISDEEVKKLLE